MPTNLKKFSKCKIAFEVSQQIIINMSGPITKN